jgi:hypothetical protein
MATIYGDQHTPIYICPMTKENSMSLANQKIVLSFIYSCCKGRIAIGNEFWG